MNIKIKEKSPAITMFGLLYICQQMKVENATEVLQKIQDCSKEVDGKLIVQDLVSYANCASICLKGGYADDEDITIQVCQNAIKDFNQVNDVISWATESIIAVMSPPSPN